MGKIRIISGVLRGRKIEVPDNNNELRPSTDRARTVLFDWLRNFNLLTTNTNALDLFCGTGILGIETFSQGVTNIDFVDNHPKTILTLHKTIKQLIPAPKNIKIYENDVFAFINKCQTTAQKYSLIFCDPPYTTTNYQKLIDCLPLILSADGVLYIESAQDLTKDININDWEVLRKKNVSASWLHLLFKT